MKRTSILLLVFCTCFALAAWPQAPTTPIYITIPANNSIQTDLISTFPTGIFTAGNGLATRFNIPSEPTTCGYTGKAPCNYYDGFGFNGNGHSITMKFDPIPHVWHVYTLMNAYCPYAGQQLATIEFVGSRGATETFPLVAGKNIRDYYHNVWANTLDNGIPDMVALNAFTCVDPDTCLGSGGTGNVHTGGKGTYVVDEQEFFLSSDFRDQDLVKIVVTDTYNGSNPILLGVTAEIGAASGPNATLSTKKLTFGTQAIQTSSSPQPVILINNGTEQLDITSIDTNPSDFSQSNNCGSSLPPGQYCTINVTFTPTQKGNRTGTVTITDNAPNSPQEVKLKGVGTVVELNPPSLDFGTVIVNQQKSLQTTLTNVGTTSLHITDITITGDTTDFSQQNDCPEYLKAGKNCTITVTFAPKSNGGHSADVSVSDNGGGSPQDVSLSGTGGAKCGGRCYRGHGCPSGCRCQCYPIGGCHCVSNSESTVGETASRLGCRPPDPFGELNLLVPNE
jgi:hypothetical protein